MRFWLRKSVYVQKLYLSWEDKPLLYENQLHQHHLRESLWELACLQHLLAECTVESSLKLNRKKKSCKAYVYSFTFAFPSYMLLILTLLFTSEIFSRIYLECKGDLIYKALACSVEAYCFLWVSEAPSCWRVSQVFLEGSLFSFHLCPICNTWREWLGTLMSGEKLSPVRCLPRACW